MTDTELAVGSQPAQPDELRDVGLFGGLDDEVLTSLARTLLTRSLRPGDVVFREGDSGRAVFVVLAGELEVLKRSRRGTEVRVSMLGPRGWFGDMSLLDVQPRSATVRALAPARLLVLDGKDLDALYRHDMKAYALVVLNLAREMSRRLRVVDALLVDVVAATLDARHGGGA